MQSSQAAGRQRIAVALSQLTTKEQPSGAQMRLMFLEKKGLDVLLEMVQVGAAWLDLWETAAEGLWGEVACSCSTAVLCGRGHAEGCAGLADRGLLM